MEYYYKKEINYIDTNNNLTDLKSIILNDKSQFQKVHTGLFHLSNILKIIEV
jgi:hypothetical protein